jgi:hypothetical protein
MIVVTKITHLSFFWAKSYFSIKNCEIQEVFGALKVNSTKFPIFWLKFGKQLTPKK